MVRKPIYLAVALLISTSSAFATPPEGTGHTHSCVGNADCSTNNTTNSTTNNEYNNTVSPVNTVTPTFNPVNNTNVNPVISNSATFNPNVNTVNNPTFNQNNTASPTNTNTFSGNVSPNMTTAPHINPDFHNKNYVDTTDHNTNNNADTNSNQQHQSQNQNQDISNSGNSHVESANNSSVGFSGNSSNLVEGSRASNLSNTGGNLQGMTNQYYNPRQYHNTPSMPVIVPPPTSPCMASIGGAGAGAGFGFSISGTYINENCEIQEAAKTMNLLGDRGTAMEIACTGKHAQYTRYCRKLAKEIAAEEGVDIQTSGKPAAEVSGFVSFFGSEQPKGDTVGEVNRKIHEERYTRQGVVNIPGVTPGYNGTTTTYTGF